MGLFVQAPAKVNLYLHIGGRRADGYHLLESLVAFTRFADRLFIEPADEWSIAVTGPLAAQVPADDGNLALRAGRRLAQAAGIAQSARLTLRKHIPVGAGLGGGSADAAAVLRGLCRLWNLDPGDEELLKLALSLGSDVPVCLASRPCWMSGTGETLSPAEFPPLGMLLVNPRRPLLTSEVFARFAGGFHLPLPRPQTLDTEEWLALLSSRSNVLEVPAMEAMPEVADMLLALRRLPGCRLARMSGSGATCFALFDDEAQAGGAADELRALHPAWWCEATALAAEEEFA